ncbi:4-deoxy-4-formamido-L-arabinose-phosphoundecaprenol deformylase [Desulfopila sp. IMCC35006]|uniref:4-deoxy-4-formamido-L-arabinose- phosphoundecaprenol deformylase n=1 Tax=Desulfopila sp. IMCC35006 TaxID=2569542 RepID=UPI0010ACFB78|nr:4-deoxy-4-formamido-L-arabinose-phosphoundecaprenol deformylase [Desulfopila sp. IMCC35006]TKB24270.1 4-deoxy-4-formamido-L-arabinose-phosphoundecaprenol deformylase [Desulfopila sp. IMCC35006]
MNKTACTTGLRIDVDTLRGTRLGVASLLTALARHKIKATFFFSVGPDNMGRHLWRLLRPTFLAKMLRSKAANLYGWDIVLRGTLWPGPIIGRSCADMIRRTAGAGHEIGLHAWDHHLWQKKIDVMSEDRIRCELQTGKEMLEQIIGMPVLCSAAPGWRCSNKALAAKQSFDFLYNSDCRGDSIFFPEIDGVKLAQPQIPVTLPTYDELIGSNGISKANYNTHLLSLMRSDQLNVLTIHAEVEGVSCSALFEKFLSMAKRAGTRFVPLRELLDSTQSIGSARITEGNTEGRDGLVATQEKARNDVHEQ